MMLSEDILSIVCEHYKSDRPKDVDAVVSDVRHLLKHISDQAAEITRLKAELSQTTSEYTDCLTRAEKAELAARPKPTLADAIRQFAEAALKSDYQLEFGDVAMGHVDVWKGGDPENGFKTYSEVAVLLQPAPAPAAAKPAVDPNILTDSLSPTVRTPRLYVDNFQPTEPAVDPAIEYAAKIMAGDNWKVIAANDGFISICRRVEAKP